MSNRVLNAAFRHSKSKGAARLVLIAMADEASDAGMLTAYRRSQSALAAKANLDVRSVRRAIDSLVELGEVEVLAVGDGRASSDYRLLLPDLITDEGGQDARPGEGGQDARPGGTRRPPRRDEMPAPSSPSFPVVPPSPLPPASGGGAQVLELVPPPPPDDPALGFPEWWGIFPARNGRKVGRAACLERWRKLRPAQQAAALVGVRHYAAWCAASNRLPKDPERWLRNEMWADFQEKATAAEVRTVEGAAGDPAPGATLLAAEERRQRRQLGQACPECNDTGRVEVEGAERFTVRPCPRCRSGT